MFQGISLQYNGRRNENRDKLVGGDQWKCVMFVKSNVLVTTWWSDIDPTR